MLRTLQNTRSDRTWLDINDINLPELPTVDCLEAMHLTDALRALCAVGLAEVWTWLRTPGELSDGQRWRLKLAVALRAVETEACAGARETILSCDEFAAGLDRITAAVVARELRRRIAATPIAPTCSASACRCSAIVATCDPDLLPALEPAVVAHCDFGLIHIERRDSAHEQE